jgi:hypothetical protein
VIEFSALGILLILLSSAWADSLDERPGNVPVTILSVLSSIGALICLVLAAITLPWGDVL